MSIKLFFLAFFLPLALLMAEPPKPATFEIRAVLDEAGLDTEEMTFTVTLRNGEKGEAEKLHIQKGALLDSSAIEDANAMNDPYAGHLIHVNFTDDGTKRFAEATRAHVGKRLAILIDGKILSAPTVREPITNGSAQISGFGKEEAEKIAALLKAVTRRTPTPKP